MTGSDPVSATPAVGDCHDEVAHQELRRQTTGHPPAAQQCTEECPDAIRGDDEAETEVSRKISAASLRTRGLATVKGAGATWKASITAKVRAWLEAHPATVAADVGAADGLIARVVAAEEHLAIGGDAATKAAHEELVRLSRHAASRPRGWRLEVKNAGSGAEPSYEVVLVRHFEDLVDELPVPVPERVAHSGRADGADVPGGGSRESVWIRPARRHALKGAPGYQCRGAPVPHASRRASLRGWTHGSLPR